MNVIINRLPEDIKEMALQEMLLQTDDIDEDVYMFKAFNWKTSKLGYYFWATVDAGLYDEARNSLKNKKHGK